MPGVLIVEALAQTGCGGNLKYGGKLWKDRVFCGD